MASRQAFFGCKNMEGWIKIHRKIQEKGFYNRSQYVHLWVHLLLSANHKEKELMWNNQIIVIREGQFVTGRKRLSEETGIPEGTIEDILNFFEKEQQIQQQKTTKYRLITVINWDTHQKIQQQSNNRATTSRHKQECKNEENEKKESVENFSEKISSPLHKPNTEKGWRDLRRAEIGKEPTRTPRTEKQAQTFDALKWKDYFRDEGYRQHGMQFFLVNAKGREAKVSKLMIDAKKTVPDIDFKGLIDWWFSGNGEWAQYEPEQCFMGKTVESFLNGKKRKKTGYKKGSW